jgi:hypothetical protein
MIVIAGLLSIVLLGCAGFALGRRWRRDAPIRWAIAAAVLQVLLLNILRRTLFDAPSEEIGNAMYRDGEISYAEAERVAAAARRAALISFAIAGVGTVALLVGARSLRGRADEEAESSEDVQIVGQTCAGCQGRIVFATDGLLCARCRSPIHEGCAGKHRAACGPEGYRG